MAAEDGIDGHFSNYYETKIQLQEGDFVKVALHGIVGGDEFFELEENSYFSGRFLF